MGEADYGAESVIVIGKDAKNVTQEEAMGCIARYTAGNDFDKDFLTSAYFQVAYITFFLSQGTTLLRGTVIMTSASPGWAVPDLRRSGDH
jgi:2-keto-4-pentenoate hydratase/2-oxohepta-3-ene-1,7-dioic acid hydratase in catechol pathway